MTTSTVAMIHVPNREADRPSWLFMLLINRTSRDRPDVRGLSTARNPSMVGRSRRAVNQPLK